MPNLTGQSIGRYHILEQLGEGAFNTAYLAEHRFTKRKVVLRFMDAQDENLAAVALSEAELLASIDHPCIVRMYDADEYEGRFYLAIEFVDGKSLSEMIDAKDKVPVNVALKLMLDIAEALEYAHQLGIVHGEIKPGNIIVSPKGTPVLIDFFVSALIGHRKLLQDQVVGTPAYIPPESWQGEYDPRSDLWSLALTFHCLLTGQLPFDENNLEMIRQVVASEESLDLSLLHSTVPKPVARILEKCLQKSAERRYQSAAELCRDIQSALAYLEQRQPESGDTSTLSLHSGITIMLNVEYKEPGIAGQYREYKVEKELGQGAFSHVYQAEDVIGNRQVALKILRRDQAGDERTVARFRREAALLARLDDPNIVHVYNYGQYAQNYFLVMEVLPGLTLKQILGRGRFQVREATAIMSQVLVGLEKLHEESVVHRDLKPDNIKLLPDRAVVMDLGLAHVGADKNLTISGEMLGTPRYMSPEQSRGMETTFQSDLYAMGVILYELLTGRIPHETDDTANLIFKIALEKPTPVTTYRDDLPFPLVDFLERMLAKEPANRFSSTGIAHEELLASVGLHRSDVSVIYIETMKKWDS